MYMDTYKACSEHHSILSGPQSQHSYFIHFLQALTQALVFNQPDMREENHLLQTISDDGKSHP